MIGALLLLGGAGMARVDFQLFDGVKSCSLGGVDGGWFAGSPDEGLSVLGAYRTVPYLYRAVDVRARAVAAMPWVLVRESGEDVTGDARYRGVVGEMRRRLYLTESSLCLYGAAYWLKETNRAGLNVTPRWLVPGSMVPRFDVQEGLVGFERSVGSGMRVFSVDEVVYFWLPNVAGELGPGVAPAQVALTAAQALHHLDAFVDGFFRRGAIKATLLTVEGNPPRSELERLESWWRRMVSGVRNAWQSVAVRSTVKPVTIGDGLSDIESRDLTVQQRENVCAALGVPHSLLSADAATYATAQQDKLTFLTETVLPQARFLEEVMNAQLCGPLGLCFRFQPERLEEMQQFELQKAQAVMALVGGPVLTVDEARALLGYGPMGAGRS